MTEVDIEYARRVVLWGKWTPFPIDNPAENVRDLQCRGLIPGTIGREGGPFPKKPKSIPSTLSSKELFPCSSKNVKYTGRKKTPFLLADRYAKHVSKRRERPSPQDRTDQDNRIRVETGLEWLDAPVIAAAFILGATARSQNRIVKNTCRNCSLKWLYSRNRVTNYLFPIKQIGVQSSQYQARKAETSQLVYQ